MTINGSDCKPIKIAFEDSIVANPYEDNTAITENYPTTGTIGDWLTTVTSTNKWDDVITRYGF